MSTMTADRELDAMNARVYAMTPVARAAWYARYDARAIRYELTIRQYGYLVATCETDSDGVRSALAKAEAGPRTFEVVSVRMV